MTRYYKNLSLRYHLRKIENLNSQYSELKVKIDQLSESVDTFDGRATNLKQSITPDLITILQPCTLVNPFTAKYAIWRPGV